MSSRGLGVDRAAREASRLVFVYVRDSKPRRKVAVPVPESLTWDQFLATIKTKLKVASIADIYLSGSGQRVRRVDELQDIDELCVVDGGLDGGGALAGGGGGAAGGAGAGADGGGAPGAGVQGGAAVGPAAAAAAAAQAATGLLAGALSGALSGGASVIGVGPAAAGPRHSHDYGGGGGGGGAPDDEGETKYVRRQGAARRTLQTLFPALFFQGPQGSSALPVSLRDGAAEGGGGGPTLARARSARPGGRAGSAGGARGRGGGAAPTSARRRALRFLLAVLAAASAVAALVFLFAHSHPDSALPKGVRTFERDVVSAERAAVAAVVKAEEAAAAAIKARNGR